MDLTYFLLQKSMKHSYIVSKSGFMLKIPITVLLVWGIARMFKPDMCQPFSTCLLYKAYFPNMYIFVSVCVVTLFIHIRFDNYCSCSKLLLTGMALLMKLLSSYIASLQFRKLMKLFQYSATVVLCTSIF